ncbi:MAG TPA: hypothetical protein VMD02_03645 [Candidatus Omnitrophota bacterium]|nr:hypothetical protein [Candidatus Omnitrophota bacterium]
MTDYSFSGKASGLYGAYNMLSQGATITDVKGKVFISDHGKESILDLSDPNLEQQLQASRGHIEVVPHEIKLTV